MQIERLRTQTQKKAVLLDFDGVILRKCKLHNDVYMRCQQYVNKHIRIRNPVKLAEINKVLYESSGHTVLGLHKFGYDVDVHGFNKFVYDYLDYHSLQSLRKSQSKFIDDLKFLREYCEKHNFKMAVFSNAPDHWCKTVLHYMSKDLEDIETLSYITNINLKPTDACYKIVEKQFRKFDHVFLVHDKMINLTSPILKHWTKVWVSETKQDSIIEIPEARMFVIGNGDSVLRNVKSIISYKT